jgi:arabinogalactan oligomer/maltooligosaccharide transport system substrate-binding protein
MNGGNIMKFKKVLAMGLVVAMSALTIAGCGTKDDAAKNNQATEPSQKTEKKDVTLTVWGPQEDQAKTEGYDEGILKAMCEKFNSEHPEWNITFKYGVCSEGDAKDNVTKDVQAAADVYMYANDQIPILVKAGALSKLGGKNVDDMKANNEQTMVDSVTYNGDVYGFPFTSNTWFMYYDKSKFSEDEVKSLDTMMAKDLGSGVTNFAFPLDNSWYLAAFYYAGGGQLFGADGSDESAGCTFDDENGVATTKYLVKLASNKKFSCEKEGSSIAKFKKGKLGAYCSGSWDAKAIKEALGKNFGVAIAPTVKINGQDGQMRSFAGSKAVGVNPMCKDPEVAVALAAYLAGEECQQIRFDSRGIAPTNKTVAASETVTKDLVTQTQAQEIANAAVVQPMVDQMGKYWTPAETMGKELVQGDVKESNAAEKVKAMVKGILVK